MPELADTDRVLAEPALTHSRPRVRRVVRIVAAATLIGYLAVDVAGRAIFPGEDYASAQPLRLSAIARPDGVGGLVEDAQVQRGSRMISTRELRPAILALVPRRCDCADRLRDAASDADGRGVPMYVVGSNGLRQANGLAAAAGKDVVPIVDRSGVLENRYHPGLYAMLLLVRRDGVVTEIVDGVPLDIDLGKRLPALLKTP
ncbi:MAG: hypothetical protein QOG49_363 [Frankiaceae bacterium]|jgi:hypothetical protein|nr:hypothetical protein [Frankiaceae bacterium]